MTQSTSISVARPAYGRIPGDGVQLAFGYWPGRGKPVVAIHGLTATHVNFIGIAECMGGRRPLFAPDLRGRGDSDQPDGPYGMAQHARDLAAAMGALDLGPSVIVGHSMGAFVATALAAQEPALVAGLVLVDGGYVPAMSGAATGEGFDKLLTQRIMQLRQTYPSREFYREFWRKQPHFPAQDWGPWIEAFLDYELGGEPPQLRPKAAEAAVRTDVAEAMQRDEIVARLKAVRVPTMMVRAESGFAPGLPALYPDSAMAEIRGYISQVEDHSIAGTTHYTIVLGRRGASEIAELIVDLAQRR